MVRRGLWFCLGFVGCQASQAPGDVSVSVGWVLAEQGGVLAWVPEEVPLAVRSWIEHRPGVGQVGVVVVRTLAPRRVRVRAVPLRPDIVLVTPDIVESDGEARFEFTGPVPGRAGIRVWADRERGRGNRE